MARRVHDAAKVCDPGAELEAPGLVPGTRLRPADVLTGALGNGFLALDVGVASPDAAAAGPDCAATMYRRKVEYYSAHADALARHNITYQPLVFTCYGRPHPRTTAILRTLATKQSRRRGCSDGEWRYRRMAAAIDTEVWRRAARQVQACWPDRDEGAT